jgi:RHS repeat-associated protein
VDSNADTATTATYTYDGAGQRTKSVVTVGSTTTTTSWAYEGLGLMYLSAVQGSTTWRIDYLCDEESVPFGGVYRSPASSTSPTYFTLVTSDRGDTVELCDADGAAFAAYRYDAWGLPQGEGNFTTGVWTQSTSLVNSTLAGQIATRQVLRYAGYVWDAESALYYCSARFYDPATRQWTTGDPAKADGEASAYQYCGGDPVGSRDPGGRKRLNVPHVRQREDNWCGAACGRSIIKWYWPNRDWKANPSLANTTPTQAHFQEYAHGNTEDESIDTDEVRAGLWGWDVASHKRDVNLITYSDVEAEIDRGEPMIIGTTTPLHLGALRLLEKGWCRANLADESKAREVCELQVEVLQEHSRRGRPHSDVEMGLGNRRLGGATTGETSSRKECRR